MRLSQDRDDLLCGQSAEISAALPVRRIGKVMLTQWIRASCPAPVPSSSSGEEFLNPGGKRFLDDFENEGMRDLRSE